MKNGWKALLVLGCSLVWCGCNAATDTKKPGTSGGEGATPAASAPESSQVTEVSGGEQSAESAVPAARVVNLKVPNMV